jgi:hypothetical protein
VTVLLIGYGTLLNVTSLGRTLGLGAAHSKSFTPAVIRGYRRLFNLRPDHYEPSLRFSSLPIEAGAMNLEPCPGALVNAVAFLVTEEELAALDRRERYYRREDVPVYRFPDQTYIDQGAIYISKPNARWIERNPKRLLPRWDDIVEARAGSYALGIEFGRMFDETTYLADGRTLVFDHYLEHLSTPPANDAFPEPSPGLASP